MTCKSLHQIILEDDIEMFEEYLKNSPNASLEFQYEDMIITNHKKEMLSLLIKYNCISDNGMSLSGMFDIDSKLLYKLQRL